MKYYIYSGTFFLLPFYIKNPSLRSYVKNKLNIHISFDLLAFVSKHYQIHFVILEFVWSQEEHQNSGAWTFVEPRFANLVGVRDLGYAGRVPLCQPAVGVGSVHQREVAHVMQETFKKLK